MLTLDFLLWINEKIILGSLTKRGRTLCSFLCLWSIETELIYARLLHDHFTEAKLAAGAVKDWEVLLRTLAHRYQVRFNDIDLLALRRSFVTRQPQQVAFVG